MAPRSAITRSSCSCNLLPRLGAVGIGALTLSGVLIEYRQNPGPFSIRQSLTPKIHAPALVNKAGFWKCDPHARRTVDPASSSAPAAKDHLFQTIALLDAALFDAANRREGLPPPFSGGICGPSSSSFCSFLSSPTRSSRHCPTNIFVVAAL